MYNLHLSMEQLEFRDTVRDFVKRHVKPFALKSERLEGFDRRLPTEILDRASTIGLRTMALSEKLGGAGAGHLTSCIVAEELAAGDADVAAILAETSALAHLLFDRLMSPAQRDRFLPQFLADHRYHLAFARHEPATDTRLGINYRRSGAKENRVATRATRSQDGSWIIDGVKDHVANAPVAKLILVEVKTDAGAGMLLVACDNPGLVVREHEETGRCYPGICGQLSFRECRVPADHLVGADGRNELADDDEPGGWCVPQYQAINLGTGRAAYEAALDYAQLRVQGGCPIIEHQAIGTKLADMAIRLEVARNAVWQAAWASDHSEAIADRSLPDLPLRTIAKVFTSETVYRITKDAAEIFGAMGVVRDMPLQKYMQDALTCLHSGDGNSDAKLRLAEALVGVRRS